MLDQIPLLNELPPGVRELMARLLLLIFVLVFALILRRILTWIVVRPLRRLAKRSHFEYDDMILKAVLLPIRFIVYAVTIFMGLEILAVGDSVDLFIANIARSLVIIGVLLLAYRLVDLLAANSRRLNMMAGIEIEDRLLPFIRTAIKLVVIAIGMVIVLQEWGYDVSGLIAGLGLGGLAFSLAAQDTISNLFGFTAIVSDNPLTVGEFIKTPDVEGIVEHVGLRSTRVRQLDQAVVYVPNNKLANSAILNWSRLSKRRIDFILGVTYDSSSGQLRVLLHRLREMLKAQETIDPDSVVVYFVEFSDSSLDVLVRAYVLLSDWGAFTAEKERLMLIIMDIINELNMSLAFPTTSLYVENLAEILNVEHEVKSKATLSPRERALMQGEFHEGMTLSLRERALMRGEFHETTTPPPPDKPGENITGQQDEEDDNR